MSTKDNGRDWSWIIAVINGFGNVCLQTNSHLVGAEYIAARKITTITGTPTGPGTVDFSFNPTPTCRPGSSPK